MSDAEPIPAGDDNLHKIDDEEIYDELLARSGGQITGHHEVIQEFLPIFKSLHSIALDIGKAYQEICGQYGLRPGQTEVVLGGGRAKGKPLKEDSDFDIFFYIQNPGQNLDSVPYAKYSTNPTNALDEQNVKMRLMQEKVAGICRERGVPNHFHILGWGADIPKNYDLQNQILLARAE